MWWQVGACLIVLGAIYLTAGCDHAAYGEHAGRLFVAGGALAAIGLALIAWRALVHYGWLR